MALRIMFDSNMLPEEPTFVLATKAGKKLGKLQAYSIICADALKEPSEISFRVSKYHDGELDHLWDKIVDFKLIWCKEFDMWFEITVQIDKSNETEKVVSATKLGHAELSQIMLYNVEINTEADISREDYEIPSTLFNQTHPEASILHRMFEKAPHYTITHVDSTIKDIQRTFSFDGKSLYDCCQEVGEEIGCLFIFPSGSDSNGKILRTVEVYDADAFCLDCGHRGDFVGKCPKCGSTNLRKGFGTDTTIFVDRDELGEDIKLTTDTDSVKNCFKLEAGDDLMTATIRNLNPNGSDYIWYVTEDMKKDMSPELVQKLSEYQELFDFYQSDYVCNIPTTEIQKYNALVDKYSIYRQDIEKLPINIVGFPALMNAFYNTVDFGLYLQSGLMPTFTMTDTTAADEAAKLTTSALSPTAVEKLSSISAASANSAVLQMAKVLVRSTYQVRVNDATFDKDSHIWTGNFRITNYSDEEDTAVSNSISVTITDNYEQFVKQRLDKILGQNENESDMSISGLFKKDLEDFTAELKKYGLSSLKIFRDSCQGCIDILIEQGVSDQKTWSGKNPDLYTDLYLVYYDKLGAIDDELAIRQEEVDLIVGTVDDYGNVVTDGLQTLIIGERKAIQEILDFQTNLGDTLWKEFCLYRREDKYTNDNYISDGLNNAELFERAKEFYDTAQAEIYQSAELQHSITCRLKDLLVIDKFRPLVDYFEVGNWIRVRVDGNVYKLRLLEYEIDFDDLTDIAVKFSDVLKVLDGESDQRDLISKAAAMTTSYESVKRQANKGSMSNTILNRWVDYGLDATNMQIIGGADNQTQTWDKHGMLFRAYQPITDDYSDIQLKIINSTIAITDNNWKSTRTALGRFIYYDPADGQYKEGYGVIANHLVSNIILSQDVGIYNVGSTIKLNEDGVLVTNEGRDGIATPVTVKINPNNTDGVFVVESGAGNGKHKVMWVDADGNGHYTGSIDIGTLTDGSSAFAVAQDGTVTIRKGGINLGAYTPESGGTDYKFKVDNNGNVTMTGTINWGDNQSPSDASSIAESIAAGTYNVGGNTFISGKVISSPTISGGDLYGMSSLKVGANAENAYDGYNFYVKSDGSLNIGSKGKNNSGYNFVVAPNGDVTTAGNVTLGGSITLSGNITWGSGASPTKCIYARTALSTTGVDYSNLNDSSASAWHKVVDGNDYYVAYTYDGGATWTGAIQFRGINGTNGTNGTNGKDGKDGKDGSDATVTREAVYRAFLENSADGIYSQDNNILIRASMIKTGTIDAGKVVFSAHDTNGKGGGFKCDTGAVSDTVTTYGAKMYGWGAEDTHYFIATNAGVRMTAGSRYFYIASNGIHSSEEIHNDSDRRVKNTISYDLESYAKMFMKLKPAVYHYNNNQSNRFHTGYIAQDVEEAVLSVGLTTQDFAGISKAPVEDDDGNIIDYHYYLRYSSFVPLNTYMIQKALKRIEALEAEIKQLKGE